MFTYVIQNKYTWYYAEYISSAVVEQPVKFTFLLPITSGKSFDNEWTSYQLLINMYINKDT
jgi:hypothetical protein